MEHENLGIDANGEATSGLNHEGESTDSAPRGGLSGIACRAAVVQEGQSPFGALVGCNI